MIQLNALDVPVALEVLDLDVVQQLHGSEWWMQNKTNEAAPTHHPAHPTSAAGPPDPPHRSGLSHR
jgi:hypothetical protein